MRVFTEVEQWLLDLTLALDPGSRLPPGVSVAEVEYVIMEANRDHYENHGETRTFAALKSKTLRPQDFGRAADAWIEYKECQEDIEAIFLKFDADADKVLNKQELGVFLTDLNELLPVSDADVSEVLSEADLLGHGYIVPINLPKAIAAWYELERKRQEVLRYACPESPVKEHFCSKKNH